LGVRNNGRRGKKRKGRYGSFFGKEEKRKGGGKFAVISRQKGEPFEEYSTGGEKGKEKRLNHNTIEEAKEREEGEGKGLPKRV